MNYEQFKRKENILERLFIDREILKKEDRIIIIDTNPDDSIVKFRNDATKEYYFINSFSFEPYFRSLIKVQFKDKWIYSPLLLQEAIKTESIKYSCTNNFEEDLNWVNKKRPDFFELNEYKNDNEFKLRELRVQHIDNKDQKFYYEGGFYSEGYNNEIMVCAKVNMIGINKDKDCFYENLLGESLLLLNNQDYRMAYFIAFTAFECYINYAGGTEDKNSRLSEKINILFKRQLGDLSSNEIYCAVFNDFAHFESLRNNIAHGKKSEEVTEKDVREFLLFCLIMIELFAKKSKYFQDL